MTSSEEQSDLMKPVNMENADKRFQNTIRKDLCEEADGNVWRERFSHEEECKASLIMSALKRRGVN